MARGDYVEVTYRTGAGVDKARVIARGVGGSVGVTGTEGRDAFVTVIEYSRSNEAVQTARFAKAEVVAIVEGHTQLIDQTNRPRKLKRLPGNQLVAES